MKLINCTVNFIHFLVINKISFLREIVPIVPKIIITKKIINNTPWMENWFYSSIFQPFRCVEYIVESAFWLIHIICRYIRFRVPEILTYYWTVHIFEFYFSPTWNKHFSLYIELGSCLNFLFQIIAHPYLTKRNKSFFSIFNE